MPWLDFIHDKQLCGIEQDKAEKRKIFHIVFHFLFLSFQAYTIKRSTGVQSSVNRSMPDIGAVSPKIDRRGIKIVHPEKVDLMNLGHKLTSEMLKKIHFGDAGDWTRGLSHAKRTRYHCATSPFDIDTKKCSLYYFLNTKRKNTYAI